MPADFSTKIISYGYIDIYIRIDRYLHRHLLVQTFGYRKFHVVGPNKLHLVQDVFVYPHLYARQYCDTFVYPSLYANQHSARWNTNSLRRRSAHYHRYNQYSASDRFQILKVQIEDLNQDCVKTFTDE